MQFWLQHDCLLHEANVQGKTHWDIQLTSYNVVVIVVWANAMLYRLLLLCRGHDRGHACGNAARPPLLLQSIQRVGRPQFASVHALNAFIIIIAAPSLSPWPGRSL